VPDFLLEVQTEELPAGNVAPALAALSRAFEATMADERLRVAAVHTTATPRRLVISAADLPDAQAGFTRETRGPATTIAFDETGQPTKAALGFARAQGLAPDDLVVREVKGTPYVFAVTELAGESTLAVLARVLPTLIARLPWPKSMRWRDRSFTFARPIRGVLALLDEEVVPFEVNGVPSGRVSPGHPFLAPEPLEIASADYNAYVTHLREAFVLVERADRRAVIADGLGDILRAHEADFEERALLEEVTDLVEWPLVLEGRFDAAYLDLPAPVLVAAMTGHQRYFPIRAAGGDLLARFAVVANRCDDETGVIAAGNERVLDGRLADARFFWNEDRKQPLAARVPELAHILYHEDLGSYLDKIGRVGKVAQALCEALGVEERVREHVLRAVHLSKADLVTEMVGEFPELQGVMGREYTLADGAEAEVANAIAEHYQPRQAGGPLPRTPTGALASLADKFDAVVACFAVGLAPTGSQDPYALRRQMQGIIRIIEDRGFRLSLREMLAAAQAQLPADLAHQEDLVSRVLDFVGDRLYHQAVDEDHPHNLVRAVLAAGFDDLTDFFSRLTVLRGLMDFSLWEPLVELVERTYKIARDAELPAAIDESLLTEPAERVLFDRYEAHADEIRGLIDAGEYAAASRTYLDAFGKPVHTFFDEVFVNVEDRAVRANRMLLCRLIHRLYAERVADLALIAGV